MRNELKKMTGDSTSMIKFVNPYPLRIDVVKFEGKNNFGMWRCKMMYVLITSNLEDTLQLENSAMLLLKRIGTR